MRSRVGSTPILFRHDYPCVSRGKRARRSSKLPCRRLPTREAAEESSGRDPAAPQTDGWYYPSAEAEQRNAGGNTDHEQWPLEFTVEARGPKHVISKKHRQIDDDADYGSRNGR